jgi:hypothetical protein
MNIKQIRLNSGLVNIFNGIETSLNEKRHENGIFNNLIKNYCPVADNNISYSCLEKLNQFKIEPNDYQNLPVILYHSFWKIDESKPYHIRVLILQILSYLTTQDLAKTKLVLWVQNEFSENVNKTLTSKFGYFISDRNIEVRVLNTTDLCSTGLYKAHFDTCVSTNNSNSVAFSDFIRFLVLYKYGGIYTDGDVIFLRDMRPFWEKNFVHRWSYGTSYNTAVMGLKLNRSQGIEAIFDYVLNNRVFAAKNLVGRFYPSRIKDTILALNNGGGFNYTDFEVYHSVLFDPAWLCNDKIIGRLNNQSVCIFSEFYDTVITAEEFDFNKFYGGAFTIHLHLVNCGKCQIGPKSFFYHFENYFMKKIGNL